MDKSNRIDVCKLEVTTHIIDYKRWTSFYVGDNNRSVNSGLKGQKFRTHIGVGF